MWQPWNRSTVTVFKRRERDTVTLDQWESMKPLKELTRRGMCCDIGSQLWCITCVLPPKTLVVSNDSLSAGTVSLMVVFTVLSTGALSGANGHRRLFITVSHRWILQGCFCYVLCFASAAVRHISGEEQDCLHYLHVSHPSSEKSSVGICSFSSLPFRT